MSSGFVHGCSKLFLFPVRRFVVFSCDFDRVWGQASVRQCAYVSVFSQQSITRMYRERERERERESDAVYSTKCSETPKGINLISRGTGATNVTMQPMTNIYCVFTLEHYLHSHSFFFSL